MLAFQIICGVMAAAYGHAAVIVPARDDEVVEVLPAVSGDRAGERTLRQRLARAPRDAEAAVTLASRYLEHARSQGDPRFAGRALAVLRAWPSPAEMPDDVLLLFATVQQFLHEFGPSAANLELLVNRRPALAQAWLTLATVRRVEGRYEDSDRACDGLAIAGPALYARACRAENDSLRGEYVRARTALSELLAAPGLPGPSRNWLLTTLAENEVRAALPQAAETGFRLALDASPDSYTTLSYADFLIDNDRPRDALVQLATQPRTDAVLLRLAIAGLQAGSPQARQDIREMRDRMTQANQRPEARLTHARELAMFALWVDKAPAQALALARENVKHQREPLDLLLFARAAATARDAPALREARALAQKIGLRDSRLDTLL